MPGSEGTPQVRMESKEWHLAACAQICVPFRMHILFIGFTRACCVVTWHNCQGKNNWVVTVDDSWQMVTTMFKTGHDLIIDATSLRKFVHDPCILLRHGHAFPGVSIGGFPLCTKPRPRMFAQSIFSELLETETVFGFGTLIFGPFGGWVRVPLDGQVISRCN